MPLRSACDQRAISGGESLVIPGLSLTYLRKNDERFPAIEQLIGMIAEGGPYLDLQHAERELERRVRDYNERPQADLGGQSPTEMMQLLGGDWKSKGPLRLNESLTVRELSGSSILADARSLLEYVRDEGPLKETPSKFLRRVDVAALRPRLLMPENPLLSRNHIITTSLNEGDVPWLHEMRFVLLFGKLVARQKGLRITRFGSKLLPVERAGELHAHLFRTFFRVLDLRALDDIEEHRTLQSTLAFSLFRLSSVARKWTTAESLAQSAWLDSTKDPPSARDLQYGDFRYYTFKHRVLEPLVLFGLLEIRPSQAEHPRYRDVEYRCAPLFGHFLTVDFSRS